MPGVTRVAILFCGQGMATLIEYYKNGNVNGTPDNLVLIDFGGNQKYSEPAAQYVVDRLKKQKKPKFDLVVISHQDGDHLSLLGALTDAIKEAGINYYCNNWYAGGTAWSAANKEKVKDFREEAMDVDDDDLAFDAPYDSNYTGAKTRSQLGELTRFASTYVRVLVSGLKLSKGKKDIIRNASSAVIVVENGNWSMILPGDATYHTMAEVNAFYEGWKTKPLVPTVAALEIPHHGALRTAVENYTAKTAFSDLDMTIIKDFAKYTNPRRVVASAGPFNTHNHPIYEVIQIFDSKNIDTIGKHTYVAYVFDKKKTKKSDGWEQFETTKGFQTTVYQINGSMLSANVYYDFNDPGTALGREPPKVTVEVTGTIEGLIQSYGAEAAADPWLQSLMASVRQAPAETILRAPPPIEGASWQG